MAMKKSVENCEPLAHAMAMKKSQSQLKIHPPIFTFIHAMHKFLDSTNFDFSKTAIIKPPFEQATNREISNKFTRVVVDSRDRDLVAYPTPNKYTIYLESEIEEVTSMTFSVIDVPGSVYNITQFNNTIKISKGAADSIEYSLEVGCYTVENLASALTNLTGINVTYSQFTKKLTWTSSDTFIIDFDDKKYLSISAILGFVTMQTYTSSEDSNNISTVSSQFVVNLNQNRYIVLSIDQMNIYSSMNSVLDRTTAMITPNAMIIQPTHPLKKNFNPPIARLVKLNLTFQDYYGNAYDFQNQNHRLEFIFESKKILNRYTSFV